MDWDDPLPSLIAHKWTNFLKELQEMPELTFPRWLGIKTNHRIEIHGFCDASQKAIAVAVYVRSTTTEGEIITNLIASKTKVAPLKRLTIPRLELSGAVLLTKLAFHILQVLEIENLPVYLWTDSTITHTWINNHPSRWKDFVHNRVCYIQETLPQAIWRFVSGTENPADLATRGVTPVQLSESSIWWTGPPWLPQPTTMWPENLLSSPRKDDLEERPSLVSTVTTVKCAKPWDLLHKYSNLTRLLRITAICRRAIARFRKLPDSSLTIPITTLELENAKLFWIKAVQQSSFHQEISILSKGNILPKSNPLVRLTPFIDHIGLLRIGGRLHSSLLPLNAKHPLILPKKSTFTSLIISDAHLRTLHGGTQITLAFIRND